MPSLLVDEPPVFIILNAIVLLCEEFITLIPLLELVPEVFM